jgi:DNA modification methylase
MIDITTLKPNPRNPRIISKEAMEKLKASIKRDPKFMEINQIKIDDTNTVLGGNQRLEACKALGMKEIPDNWVKRTGDLTDEEKLRYVVIDNSPQGISGEWDYEMLSEDFDIPELESIGIDTDKLSRFIEDKDNETSEDSTPPIPDTPKSKPNTLYQLGEHRLFVGDSTSPDNLKKLMQDKQADLLITDPPYNVNYTGKTADALTIDNDSMDDTKFLEFLTNAFKAADSVMRPGAVFYIWHADSEGFNFRSACKLTGWKVRQCLIWMKNCMVMGRQDYQWRHEPCLYGWKDGAAHTWNSDRTQTTILEFNKPSRNPLHPTMKPIELYEYQIRNSTKRNDIILDTFCGSGTAILAAHKSGRVAHACELDPKYADVIRMRYVELVHGKDRDWESLTPEIPS